MIIDHIGIVVKSIKDGIRHWEDFFGYRQATTVHKAFVLYTWHICIALSR